MTKWIACVDYTDGDDRESWSVFYVDMFVADTEAEAQALGDAALAAHDGDGEVEVRQANEPGVTP